MSSQKLKELTSRREEISGRIRIAEKAKEEIISLIQNLVSQLNSRKITREEYKERLNEALGERTSEQWLEYYDKYLATCKEQLSIYDKAIRKEELGFLKERAISVLTILIILVLICLFASFFFILKPAGITALSKIGNKIFNSIQYLTEKAPEVPAGTPKISTTPTATYEEPKVPVILEDKQAKISEESLVQYQAVVGKPVKWKKKFTADSITGFTVELPKGSGNITVRTLADGKEKDVTNTAVISKKRNFLIFGEKAVEVRLSTKGITGNLVADENEKYILYEIEYETPAPEISESETGGTAIKRVLIKGPDDVHYKDILSFTELPQELSNAEIGKLKLYEIKNNQRENVKFIAYDTNENGLIDYIEWSTPELSEAVFELVIEISKAEHLDAERNFVSDIYESVKALDGNWSETINNNEHVRVTFKQNLANKNDITFYGRSTNGTSEIEVYRENDNNLVAKFESINEENWHKVYLSSLAEGESYDVFDLKILGEVEFDYIVDPSDITPPLINFTFPTPANGSITNNNFIPVNVTSSDSQSNISVFIDFDSSLAGWWRMDEYNNTGVFDNSSYNHFGKFNGNLDSSRVVAGFFGKAVNFDGWGDYIGIGSNIGLTNRSGAISAWFKSNEVAYYTTRYITSYKSPLQADRIYLYIHGNNDYVNKQRLGCAFGDDLDATHMTSLAYVNDSQWHFAAIVWNSTGASCYLDKVYIGSYDYSLPVLGGDFNIGISSETYSENLSFNGSIDDVILFNRTLSTEEISALYANSSSKYLFRNFTNLTSGDHTFKAYAQDAAGNVNATEKREVKIASWTEVIGCRDLTEANSYYKQILDITFGRGSACINITSPNITFDCQGYYIKINENYTGVYSNQLNTTIKNCNISMNNSNGGYGIYLNGATDSYIFNSTLNGQNRGIYLSSTSNNTLINIKADSNSQGIWILNGVNNILINNSLSNNKDYGIVLEGGSKNVLINNTENNNFGGILGDGLLLSGSSYNLIINNTFSNNSRHGVFLTSSSSNNNLTNNLINFNSVYGIYIYQNSNSNNLVNNIANNNSVGIYIWAASSINLINNIANNNSEGIRIRSSSNNNITDSIFSVNTVYNTHLHDSSVNNTLLNVSYNISKEYVESGSQLIRAWYYQANASDTLRNPVGNANVTAYNVSGAWQFDLATKADGLTNITTIIDYTSNGTINYYSEYVINATNRSLSESHKLNVTWKTQQTDFGGLILDNIILREKDITPPLINFTFPTPANGSITNNNFIPVNVTSSDSQSNISVFIDFDSSLAGWWRMDDINASGGVIDYTGRNNGSKQGNANQTADGKLGKGFIFDGYGDYINLGSNIGMSNNSGSVTVWFKRADVTSATAKYIFGHRYNTTSNDRIYIYINGDSDGAKNQSVTCGFGNDALPFAATSTQKINDSQWHFAAILWNSSIMACYLDTGYIGHYDYSISALNGLVTVGIPPSLTANLGFNGTIDDVMVFNRTLTPEEISALYANTSSKYLLKNFTNLTSGDHTFKAYAQDAAGNVNATEKREVKIIDITPPLINFTFPTPANGNLIYNNFIPINVTADDSGKGDNYISTFIDFDSSLVSWWRMDDINASEGVIDYTGRNNGTAYGNAHQGQGYLGKGFELDGLGDVIDFGDKDNVEFGTNDFSISAWYYIKGAHDGYEHSGNGQIITKYYAGSSQRQWFVGVNASGNSYIYTNDGTNAVAVYSNSQLQYQWVYIVAVKNSTNEMIYINGVLDNIGPMTNIDPSSPANLIIGGLKYSTYYYQEFNGTIDDVMIFNRSLSDEEIKGLYANLSVKYLFNNFQNLADGNHAFKAYAQDAAGNVNSTEIRSVYLNTSQAPQIIYVQNIPDVDLDSGRMKNVSFNFTVYDGNGYSDINDSSAKADFTRGNVVRNSADCSRIAGWGNYVNYSCKVGMWYFDSPGYWNITVLVKDNSQNSAVNNSAYFLYKEGGYFDINPYNITWAGVSLGGASAPADNNISIRNLGNKNIFNIIINATRLNGTQYPDYNISASNFSVNLSSSDFCNGYSLAESQNVTFNLFINYTDSSELAGPANKTLGFCLRPLANIPVQMYKSVRDWLIDAEFSFILYLLKAGGELALAIAVIRKKKKNVPESFDEKLKDKYIDFESLLSLDTSLKEKYNLGVEELINIARKKQNRAISITSENLLESLDESLRNKYSLGVEELLSLAKKEEIRKEIKIPLAIFREKIGVAEVLCKYLKENLKLKFSEIARLTNRDERSIWVSYRNATKKKKERLDVEERMLIPISILSDRRLSVLEAIVNYLKERGFRNSEISEILCRDQRNIYTLYSRARKKLLGVNN